MSGTEMYVNECAGCSADWYSDVGEGYWLPVFGVQLEVLDCLNGEGRGSNLQRMQAII